MELLDHLNIIITKLSNGSKINLPEYARKYDIAESSIREKLSELQKFFYKNDFKYKKSSNCWEAVNQNFLKKTLLSVEEVIVLYQLDKSKTKLTKNLLEVYKDMKNKYIERASTDIYRQSHIEKIENIGAFPMVKNYIQEKSCIEFIFSDKKRKVFPIKIINLEEFWYLLAFEFSNTSLKTEECTTSMTIKTYTLKNISNIKKYKLECKQPNIDIKSIEERTNKAINAYFKADSRYQSVELIVDKTIKKHLERIPYIQNNVHILKDGNDYLFKLKVTKLAEIAPLVLKYMPKIKVISPLQLHKYIQEMTSKYDEHKIDDITQLNQIEDLK